MRADDFIRIVRDRLRETGLTTHGAAVSHDLPRGAIRSVLDGHTPKLDRAARICEALGLELYVGPPRELDLELAAQGISDARVRWREERAQDALRNLVARLLYEIADLRRDLAALVGRAGQQPLQDTGAEEVAESGAWSSATEAEREQATQRLAAIERSNALASEEKPRAEADAIAGKEAGVSASAVGTWRRRIKGIASAAAQKEALLDRPRTGRPSSLDASMQKTLEDYAARRGRRLTAEEARLVLIELHGRAPNVSTIRRWLKRWQDEYGDGRLEPGQLLPPDVKALGSRDQAGSPGAGDHTEICDRIIDLVLAAYGPCGTEPDDEEYDRLVATIRELFDQMDDAESEEGS
ncbi:MAG: hypothetical protein OXI75_06625 [Rhodospirillales bacterium]|nr:hypothetical protein [Rhodospirillales bacterium]